MKKINPTVELTIPVLPDMELLATQTSAAVAKHMNLDEEKTAEINMALSEACINAFEHSGSESEIEIHFKISKDSSYSHPSSSFPLNQLKPFGFTP